MTIKYLSIAFYDRSSEEKPSTAEVRNAPEFDVAELAVMAAALLEQLPPEIRLLLATTKPQAQEMKE